MKKFNMTISILFIMFTTNSMGMEVDVTQEDSPEPLKINENSIIIGKNIEFKNAKNQNLFALDYKDKMYADDVAVPELTDLFDYIRFGKLKDFENLLTRSPELTFMTDSRGNDALIVAAYYGCEKFIKFLLSNKTLYNINLYAVNEKGENALLLATREGYIAIVKLLIEQNSDIMNATENWSSAFIEACENNHWDIAEHFLNNFNSKTVKRNRLVRPFLKGGLAIIEESNDTSSINCKKVKQLIKDKLV